jgi:hypothetical protein
MKDQRDVDKKTLGGAIQTLRLDESFDSGLTQRLRMQSQVIQPAERASDHIASAEPVSGLHTCTKTERRVS